MVIVPAMSPCSSILGLRLCDLYQGVIDNGDLFVHVIAAKSHASRSSRLALYSYIYLFYPKPDSNPLTKVFSLFLLTLPFFSLFIIHRIPHGRRLSCLSGVSYQFLHMGHQLTSSKPFQVISNSNIRYTGIFEAIDQVAQTVCLREGKLLPSVLLGALAESSLVLGIRGSSCSETYSTKV